MSDLPQWERDLLTTRWLSEQAPTEPHTCLTPRGRQVYVCLRVKIVWDWRSDVWRLTCLEPGCSHTDAGPIAHDLAGLGRIHIAAHGGRS